MSKCVKIRRKHRKICISDLDSEILLVDRSIQPPLAGSADFTERFLEDIGELEPVWALIETVSGKTFFDGVGTETPITHNIYIEYDELITAEFWIILDVDLRPTLLSGDKILDILSTQDLEERHEWLKLECTVRGNIGKAAAQA